MVSFIFCNPQTFGVAEKEMPLKIWSPFSLPVEILPILSRTSPRFIRHGRRFGDVPLEREPKRLAAVLQKARCYSGLLLKGGGIFARK